VARLAIDAGLGGAFGRVEYDLAAGKGLQRFGSMIVRVGVDAEFVLKRVAFVLSVRSYGVLTPEEGASNSGALFEGASGRLDDAPVPHLQTWLMGSAGVAYRF
jgi:hypothetical protein